MKAWLIAGLKILTGNTSTAQEGAKKSVVLSSCSTNARDTLHHRPNGATMLVMHETLLEEVLTVALETKALKPHMLKHVNIDTAVHEKAIAFPTDARLYHKVRVILVREAHKRHIPLRQSFKKVGKKAFIMQGRYASAKQT